MNLFYFLSGKIGTGSGELSLHSHSGNKAMGLSRGRACRRVGGGGVVRKGPWKGPSEPGGS